MQVRRRIDWGEEPDVNVSLKRLRLSKAFWSNVAQLVRYVIRYGNYLVVDEISREAEFCGKSPSPESTTTADICSE